MNGRSAYFSPTVAQDERPTNTLFSSCAVSARGMGVGRHRSPAGFGLSLLTGAVLSGMHATHPNLRMERGSMDASKVLGRLFEAA